MAAPVVHFEILGKDAEKLQSFYSKIFDWEIDANNPMKYGMVQPAQESGAIGGGVAQAPDGETPQVTVYIEVDDPQAYLDKISGMGGQTIVPVTEIPDMVTFALFADPEGNVVGLVKSTQ